MKKFKFSTTNELINNIEAGDFIEFIYDDRIYVSSLSLVIKKIGDIVLCFVVRDTNKSYTGLIYKPGFLSPQFWNIWKQ